MSSYPKSNLDKPPNRFSAARNVWLSSAPFINLGRIGPKNELEGMIAAQLLAAHNAAMECYRRAMIGEQTCEGRCENSPKPTSFRSRKGLCVFTGDLETNAELFELARTSIQRRDEGATSSLICE